MPIHRQIYYTGRVQGVGFRYSVKELAAGYEVTGSVRNLPDGRVELLASGDAPEVDAFVEAIARSHLKPHIKEVSDQAVDAPTTTASGFQIRH